MGKSIQFKNKDEEKIYPHPYYPIGSIYLSVNNTNPSKWFDGTWELIAQGRTLVGVDANDTDFNEAKKTGGEKTHILTNDEAPIHNHEFERPSGWNNADYVAGGSYWTPYQSRTSAGASSWTKNSGGGKAHNNMQPFFTCYIWCRVA